MSRKLASLLAAIAIGFASVTPANADQGIRISHVAVSYGDLDLTRAEGVKALTYRLKSAVDQVCGRAATSASLTVRRMITACREQAMNDAVVEINAPLLTALYGAGEVAQFARR